MAADKKPGRGKGKGKEEGAGKPRRTRKGKEIKPPLQADRPMEEGGTPEPAAPRGGKRAAPVQPPPGGPGATGHSPEVSAAAGPEAGLPRAAGRKSPRVSEIMTEDPVSCVPDTPLARVARLMAENSCGAIPVIAGPEDRSPVGIITDRDVAVRTVALGRNPLEMTAGEIMSAAPVTVRPDESVEECAALMRLHQLRRIIVVDGRGRVCGLVVQSQIARHLPRDISGETVRDISKPPQDV
jgi:CBS domain-containing protein